MLLVVRELVVFPSAISDKVYVAQFVHFAEHPDCELLSIEPNQFLRGSGACDPQCHYDAEKSSCLC